jgi:predicted phage terminase large subunit-like protein
MVALRTDERRYSASEAATVAALCRKSFFAFVKEFWKTVEPEKPVYNWHVRYLCRRAQKLAERVFKRQKKLHDQVVNISPGTTKSLIWSVFLPAWMWTRDTRIKFLGVSYAFELAQELSKKTRDIITSDKFRQVFGRIKIRDDQKAKKFFQNTDGGIRYAAGVDGAVTGYHFHMIVIDDPLNPKQALSPAELKHANEWIKGTIASRKVSRRVTVTVLVMQRLAQDDPTDLFLKRKRVHHVCLPIEVTPHVKPEFLRKYYSSDGLMDPVRYSWDDLEEAKENGDFHYASQYLQTPVPLEGGMFKVTRIKYGVPPGKYKRRCRFWDKAGTKDGLGAYTVGVDMALDDDNRVWVLDVQRFRKDSYEREQKIKQVAEYMDGRKVIVGVEQEPGSGGKESAENTVRNLQGFRVKVLKVNKSDGAKEQRADPFSTQVNGGNVYVPLGAGWVKDYIEELKYFPASRYKDQVDASSGAYTIVSQRKRRVGGLRGTR